MQRINNKVSKEIPHPGIAGTEKPETFRYYMYYQWVYFVFFVQALFFYAPRWLWKTWEKNLIQILVGGFEARHLGEFDMRKKMDNLILYVIRTWNKHNWYAMKYMFCEFLALINVGAQFLILNRFFGGRFMTYGVDVINYALSPKVYTTYHNATLDAPNNPMVMLFPRVTKCILRMYGKTSEIEVFDILCIMTLNIINEKFFLFLWFWLLLLMVLTALELMKNIIFICLPFIRACALVMHTSFVDQRKIRMILRKGTFGDWFLLDLLSLNLDETFYTEFIDRLTRELPF
ncbi:innexin inx1 [Trichonephila clavipes]|nr:innexin inx1 [Trichonephila clavipes]